MSKDYMDLCTNYISWLVWNIKDVRYEDFDLDEEDTKYFSRTELNTLWHYVTDL